MLNGFQPTAKKPFVKMAKEAHAGKEPQRGGLLGVAVRRCQTAYS